MAPICLAFSSGILQDFFQLSKSLSGSFFFGHCFLFNVFFSRFSIDSLHFWSILSESCRIGRDFGVFKGFGAFLGFFGVLCGIFKGFWDSVGFFRDFFRGFQDSTGSLRDFWGFWGILRIFFGLLRFLRIFWRFLGFLGLGRGASGFFRILWDLKDFEVFS